MKKLLFFFITALVLIFALTLPTFAQTTGTNTTTFPANETTENDYIVANDSVTLSGNVQGDAYIAGGSITVDGNISNDLLAAGGNILVTGNVEGDIRVAGGNITLSGAQVGGNITTLGGQITIDNSSSIGGSMVAAGGNVQILSPITNGLNIAGGNVVIDNSVGGDINAAVGELAILNNANVEGDLMYWSDNDASISNNASISGTITKELPTRAQTQALDTEDIAAGVASALFFVRLTDTIILLVIGLIFISLLPVYTNRVSEYIRDNIGTSLLLGLVGVLLTPIIIGILMVTFFGIPIAILLLVLYLAMLWLARIFALTIIGRFILDKTNNKKGLRLSFTVGVVIYFLVSLLPIISTIVDIIIVLSGVGAALVVEKNYYTELRQKKII